LLLAGGGGAIVNNASVSGMNPTRNEAAYSAAKAGVIALTKSGALEYGPTVRVNCVAPGHVRTPLTAPAWEHFPDVFDPAKESLPLQRVAEAAEIAEVILFLASERSSYITGQTIVVDGGATLPQAGTDPALRELFRRLS
jgi:NAD(P)-dependent dehydrogenase (short-subunit alcohol dehydrogenase family)